MFKDTNLSKLTRPCSAFVTLENEESFKRASRFNQLSAESSSDEIRNFPIFLPGVKPIKVKAASQPSDIIWENRMLTTKNRRIRKLIVAGVMSAALIGSFLLVFEGTKE